MIHYLEKLVEERQYEKALEYAEELLREVDNNTHELVAIYCAILKSALELGEYHRAQIYGELSIKWAKILGDWDRFGVACWYTGVAYAFLRRNEEAVHTCYEYLSQLYYYDTAAQYELIVRHNLAIFYTKIKQYEKAKKVLYDALKAASCTGQHRYAHGIRHALIMTYIESGDFKEALPLLAKCLHYIRHNQATENQDLTHLWHMILRARFAMATKRFERAKKIALRGLQRSGGYPRHRFQFYMILAHISYYQGNSTDALAYSLSARRHAVVSRRFDLESEAADFVYEVTKQASEVLSEFNLDYLSMFMEGL